MHTQDFTNLTISLCVYMCVSHRYTHIPTPVHPALRIRVFTHACYIDSAIFALPVLCVSLTDFGTTFTIASFTAPLAQLQPTPLLHPGGEAHIEHMYLHTSRQQWAEAMLCIWILPSSF